MPGNENDVTVTIFYLASNGRFFLSVYDAALFGAIEPMLHKKPFLKNRNENDVTVSIFYL
jgi:uncharacterized membrane protein YciS (DUF1049 family)